MTVQMNDIKQLCQCALLVSVIVLSGCVTVPVSVDSTVSKDGTIQTYDVQMNMSQDTYDYVDRSVRNEGHGSIEEYFRSDLKSRINTDNVDNIKYSESSEGENVSIQMRLKGYTPSEDSPISTTTENGSIVYVDQSFMSTSTTNEHPLSGMPLDYTVTMPGTIQNSTADSVEEDTATWNLTGSEASDTRIYVKSEKPTGFLSETSGILPFIVLIGTGFGLVYWFRRSQPIE